MTDHNDTPLEGRVYPAGTPVRSGPVMLPAHAPKPGDIPPWHDNPPPPRPEPEPDDDAPDAGEQPTTPPPVQHIHVYLPDADIDLNSPEDIGPRWWERALDRVRPWHTLLGAVLALIPVPGHGYSAAATWASTVWYAHEELLWAGYALATVGVWSAVRAERRVGNGMVRATAVRAWTVCALVGITGAIDLWDPIQIMTGVDQ